MDVLQNKLHNVAQHWNTHRIRPSANLESPSGRPDIYFVPQLINTQDYTTPAEQDTTTLEEIEIAEQEFGENAPQRGCSTHFNELAEMIMHDERLQMPEAAVEAERLYITLLSLIDDLS